MLSCKVCAVPLPADPAAIRRHADTHLTEHGLCRVCGASFPDRAAGDAHSLSHVGVQLFTCDMCHLQFCSQNKLLRHHHQSSSGYTIPQAALINSSSSGGGGGLGRSSELQCAVCTKTLSKDFQVSGHLKVQYRIFWFANSGTAFSGLKTSIHRVLVLGNQIKVQGSSSGVFFNSLCPNRINLPVSPTPVSIPDVAVFSGL